VGFSIVELIVAMTVLAALGLALTQLLLAEGRFSDQQSALRSARAVSRQSMNVLLSELRMVQDMDGIELASADGKTIRVVVPYAFALNCDDVGGPSRNVISVLPVDSLSFVQAKYAGYAWRDDATGLYELHDLVGTDTPATSTAASRCKTTAQIDTVKIGTRKGLVLDVKPRETAAARGSAVFLYQRVTYAFKASVAVPGRYGLWRQASGGSDEELVAPFDSSSRFKYWAEGASVAVASPPSLSTIRGLDIVFVGTSANVPNGRTTPMKSTIVTSVFFKNIRSF